MSIDRSARIASGFMTPAERKRLEQQCEQDVRKLEEHYKQFPKSSQQRYAPIPDSTEGCYLLGWRGREFDEYEKD